jgi:hypothetical protein
MWFVNVLVNAATNFATSDNMLGSLIVSILAGLLFLYVWHRSRVRDGKRSVEPWHLIIGGMSGVVIFAAVALGGAIWQYRGAHQRAPASPSQGNDTHLGLKFGPSGSSPIATDLANIWRWYALQSIAVMILPDGQRKEIKSWNLFMTFEKPVDVKQVIIEGDKLPQYEVKDRDSRSVVVAFLGDISDASLRVRIDTSVGAQAEAPKSDTPAQTQSTQPQVARLIKDPHIDWDAHGRLSLQGRYTRSDGQISVYVAYGQTGGPIPSSVIGGQLAIEPRIKIGSLIHLDREEKANITIGNVTAVEGDQQVLQWGEPQQNNTKVGITWGSYFGSIILVWPDGKEEPYSFAIVSKSQERKPVPPVVIGPDILANVSKDGGKDSR